MTDLLLNKDQMTRTWRTNQSATCTWVIPSTSKRENWRCRIRSTLKGEWGEEVHDEIDPDSRHRRERSLCLDYFCAHLPNDNSLANEPTSNVIFWMRTKESDDWWYSLINSLYVHLLHLSYAAHRHDNVPKVCQELLFREEKKSLHSPSKSGLSPLSLQALLRIWHLNHLVPYCPNLVLHQYSE